MATTFISNLVQGNIVAAEKSAETIFDYFLLLHEQFKLLEHVDEFLQYFNSLPSDSAEHKKAEFLSTFIELMQGSWSNPESQLKAAITYALQLNAEEQELYLVQSTLNLAQYYLSTSNYEAAISQLLSVQQQLDTPNCLAHVNLKLGQIYNQIKDLEKAIMQFNDALILLGGNNKILQLIIKANLADSYICYGEIDAARIRFEQLLHLSENNIFIAGYCLELLGRIEQLMGQHVVAEQHYQAALANYSLVKYQNKVQQMYYNLACICYFQRKYQQSISYLNKIGILRDPDTYLAVKVYFLYIENYLSHNDIQSAKVYLQKSIQLQKLKSTHYISTITKLAESLIWKAYPRMHQKSIAFSYLKELVNVEDIEIELQLKAIYEYIDLLLLEYSVSEEPVVEQEITMQISKITEIAQKFKSPIISFKLLVITATYFLTINNFKQFKQAISEIQNLSLSEQIVKPVVENLNNQYSDKLSALEKYKAKNQKIFEKLQLESYKEYLKEVSKILQNSNIAI